jgi:hypothetical protein
VEALGSGAANSKDALFTLDFQPLWLASGFYRKMIRE